jgi:hypothetical protein
MPPRFGGGTVVVDGLEVDGVEVDVGKVDRVVGFGLGFARVVLVGAAVVGFEITNGVRCLAAPALMPPATAAAATTAKTPATADNFIARRRAARLTISDDAS